jgi:MFS family permease
VIGLTHLPAAAVVPVACGLLALAAWYWTRLGDPQVPAGRRRLRRMSLGAAVAGVPAVAAGFAIVDPDERPVSYALVWAIASVAILAAVALAMLDAIACVAEWRLERQKLLDRRRRDLELTIEARARRGGER